MVLGIKTNKEYVAKQIESTYLIQNVETYEKVTNFLQGLKQVNQREDLRIYKNGGEIVFDDRGFDAVLSISKNVNKELKRRLENILENKNE